MDAESPVLRVDFDAAMRELCSRLGAQAHDAEPVKHTVNAVYRIPVLSMHVRLGYGEEYRADSHLIAAKARALALVGAPVVRLVDHVEQPIEWDDVTATLWQTLPQQAERWQGGDLGLALRELHSLTPPSGIPQWEPFAGAAEKLAAAESLSASDRAWLADEMLSLGAQLEQIQAQGDCGVIHGDATLDNLLRDPSGRVVFADLDTLGWGLKIYDLVPVAVNGDRFGNRGRRLSLPHVYGVDVRQHPAWPVLRRVREVHVLTFVFHRLDGHEALRGEVARRIDDLRHGRDEAPWTSYMSLVRQ